MNKDELSAAQSDLGQTKQKSVWFWIAIALGIVFGVIILGLAGLFLLFFFVSWSGSTYPFIPTPRNTVQSSNKQELLMNIIMDINETGDKYGVISRQDLAQ